MTMPWPPGLAPAPLRKSTTPPMPEYTRPLAVGGADLAGEVHLQHLVYAEHAVVGRDHRRVVDLPGGQQEHLWVVVDEVEQPFPAQAKGSHDLVGVQGLARPGDGPAFDERQIGVGEGVAVHAQVFAPGQFAQDRLGHAAQTGVDGGPVGNEPGAT